MTSDDELPNTVEGIEEEVAPTQPLSGWVLLSDLLNNVGGVIESIATIPHDMCLRIQGHVKWQKSRQLDMAEAAHTIERLEQYANEGSSDATG